MNPNRVERIMRAEVGKLRRERLIDHETYEHLLALYPATAWNHAALGRWFLVFGAVSTAAGVLILGSTLFEPTLETLAVFLTLLIVGCTAASIRLRSTALAWTKRAIELVGGITLIGLSFTLGAIYSQGSGNWPALLLVDLVILLPLTYARRNVLLLTLSVVVFFAWFGGVTGYASGWGMYWFSMNYPMRFLLAGLAMAGFAVAHRSAEQARLRAYEGFFKVWLAGGLFFAEMSIWLMALFGNFGSIFDGHRETAGELLFFNLLWAGLNVGLLHLGTSFGLRMLRGYAITFFVIQAYTVYFDQVAGYLGEILGAFIAGAVTLAIVVHLERRRRREQ